MSTLSSDTQPIKALQAEVFRLKHENQQMRDYIGRLMKTIRALNDLHQQLEDITPSTDLITLINKIMVSAISSVDANDGSLILVDEETSDLVFVEVLGEARERLLGFRLKQGVGVVGYTVKTRKPQLVPNVLRNPAFTPQVDKLTGFRTHSLICVPLMDGERVLGAIEVVNPEGRREFSQQDLDVLLLVARLASLAIVKAEKVVPE
jgi:GAF domain-containing protein